MCHGQATHWCIAYQNLHSLSSCLSVSGWLAGSWTITNAVELRWAEGDAWTVTAELPPGVYEYKYVVIDYTTKQPKAWQQGGNSVLAISVGEKEVDVHDNWCVL
jgi:hypothetical protein